MSIPEEVISRKAGSEFASGLIHDLLRSEPTRSHSRSPLPPLSLTPPRLSLSRLGYEETIGILRHPFFQNFDTISVLQQTAIPPFVPGDPSEEEGEGVGDAQRGIYSSLTSDEMMKRLRYQPYKGKNSIFQDFGPMFE